MIFERTKYILLLPVFRRLQYTCAIVRPVSAYPPTPTHPQGGRLGDPSVPNSRRDRRERSGGTIHPFKLHTKKIQRFGGFSKCSAQSEIIFFFLLYSQSWHTKLKPQFLGSCCTYRKSEHTVGKSSTLPRSQPWPFFRISIWYRLKTRSNFFEFLPPSGRTAQRTDVKPVSFCSQNSYEHPVHL